MSACTFFGHRECPESITPLLHETIVDLIENKGVTMFYVGNQGQFDLIAAYVLRALKAQYEGIDYAIVLAYLPKKHSSADSIDFSDTIFPEGIENTPIKFSVSWRNNWMLQRSDWVISYVRHSWGGAAQFEEKARRQNKQVINISSLSS